MEEAAALCTAASEGNLEMMTLLLENGISPNCCDYDQRAPIHIAAVEGRRPPLEVLLQHGGRHSTHPTVVSRRLSPSLHSTRLLQRLWASHHHIHIVYWYTQPAAFTQGLFHIPRHQCLTV